MVLLAVFATACAGHRAPDPRDMSGFLDDYSLLRPGGAGELPFVYRNPQAQWTAYHKVILEPAGDCRNPARWTQAASPSGDVGGDVAVHGQHPTSKQDVRVR